MNQIILLFAILVVLLIIFWLVIQQFNSILEKQNKINDKLTNILDMQKKFDAFLLPTYNNSIRIAKKFGVYYCYNKDDFEKHKNEKSSQE